MIQVHVMDLRRTMGEGSVVLLQENNGGDDGRILPIFIGRHEANAIDIGLQELKYPRPMTHDLAKNMVEAVGIVILSIEITEIRDRTYFAEIVLGALQIREEAGKETAGEAAGEEGAGEPAEQSRQGEHTYEEIARISSRPSDAIAIAVRAGCEIAVDEEIMREAGIRMSDMFQEAEEQEYSEEAEEDSREIIDRFKDFIEDVKPQDFDNPGSGEGSAGGSVGPEPE